MSNAVKKQRMKELSSKYLFCFHLFIFSVLLEFLNDLIDTRKCIISSMIYFNIFDSIRFLNFVDENSSRRNVLEILRDEQQKRISDILKQFESIAYSP